VIEVGNYKGICTKKNEVVVRFDGNFIAVIGNEKFCLRGDYDLVISKRESN